MYIQIELIPFITPSYDIGNPLFTDADMEVNSLRPSDAYMGQ